MKRFTLRMFCSIVVCSLMVASLGQRALSQKPTRQKAKKAEPMSTQPSAPQQWSSIAIVHVRPDMVTEYEDFVKKEAIPAQKKAGVKWRNTWQTANFGEGFEYVIATPIEDFAQYDGQSAVAKALGPEGMRAYTAKQRKYITSVHTYAVVDRPDLSYQGQMAEPKLGVVTITHVVPGHIQEFENIVKNDVVPAMKKAGVPGFFVSQTIFGGNANEYVSVTLYNSFADIGKGSPMIRSMGQEWVNKLLQKGAGIIAQQERVVARYNADLSYMPPMTPEKK